MSNQITSFSRGSRWAAGWLLAVAAGWLLTGLTSAQYATQTWDTGTGTGIQMMTTNVAWSVHSNAWASTTAGTTTPGTWTNGNAAIFTYGGNGGFAATATVFNVVANSISFLAYNGVYVFMPGSGALTNGAGGIYSANGNSMLFNNDIVMSANQAWMINPGSTLTVTGRLSGAGIQLTISSPGTVALSSPANSFSGGLVINNGTLTGSGGGTVLGTGPITLGTVVPTNVQAGMQANTTVSLATLNVNAGTTNTTTTAGNLTINGGAVLQLNDQANITNTLNAGTLARQGTGTLVVIAANLGTREQVYFSGGTALNNSILAPWLVTSGNNGDFLTYGAKGLTNATSTSVFGANNVVSTNVLTTLTAPQSAYALKLNGVNLNLNGNALTIGDGTTAGLILNSASITNGGAAAALTFGPAEALVYVGNTGTIGVEVSGSSGLTKSGAGTLVISNQNLWAGPITINGGTVVLSPTADLTYTNNITGLGNLTKAGSQTLILTNGYTIGGTIAINGGTLNLGGGTSVVNSLAFNGGNNTLVISNGADVYPLNTWSIAGAGTNTVIVTGAGSALTNGNSGVINMNGTGNGPIISSGAVVAAPGTYIGTGATASNSVLVTGPGSILSNYNYFSGYTPLIIGNSTGNGNSVIVSNGGAVYTVDPRNASGMMMGFSTGNSNSLLVTGSGSVDTNAGTVYIGYGANSAFNSVSIVNSGKFAMSRGLDIGYQSGSSSNIVTVSDTNSFLWANGALLVGGGSAYMGNFGNQLIVSNGGQAVTLGAASIGTSTNSGYNAVIVTGGGSVWSNTGSVTIGNTNGFANSVMITDGALASLGAVLVGRGPGSTNNTLLVTTGGSLMGGAAITIGQFAGASNNSFTVAGGSTSNGLITVGLTGGDFNTMLVSNGTVLSAGLTLGNLADSNTVTLTDNSSWDMLGGQLTFGNGIGNTLLSDATSTITNAGGLGLLGSSQTFTLTNNLLLSGGSVIVTANVALAGGSLTIGTTGLGDNSLLISNQTFRSAATSFIGSGASNNLLTILADTVWDGGAAGLTIGTGAATGNVLIVNGGIATNNGAVVIGASAASDGNSLVITNGGQMGGSTVTIGSVAGAADNSALVTGVGSIWSNTGVLKFGPGANNSFTAADGAQVTVDNFQTGAGTSNQFLFTGTNTVARTTSTSVLTFGGSYNSLIVSNGANLFEAGGAGNQGYVSFAGYNNKFVVTGTGSVFKTPNSIFVDYSGGSGGTNQIIIADGGLIVDSNLDLQRDGGMQLIVTGGGGLTNTGGTYPLQIGWSGAGSSASAIVSNGGYIINTTGGAIIGLGAAGNWASNSTMIVTGAGSVLSNASTLWISQYGSYDALTIANRGTVFSTTGNIGVNSTSSFNVATLTDTGSVWRNSGAINVGGVQVNTYNNQLIISNGALAISGSGGIGGGSSQANSNAVTVTGPGSAWTNTGALTIGGAVSDNWNSLTVTNGGTYIGGGAIAVGTGGTSNLLAIVGADIASTFSNNGLVTIGSNRGGFNTMTATNANLWIAGLTIGSGSSNNTVTALNGSTWDLLAGNVMIGAGAATGNVLRVEGGAALTNIGTLWLTNNLNQVNFNGGTLSLRNAFVSNQVFTVGDGTQAATLQSLVGTQRYASGLLMMSNATLKGVGTIRGTTILTNGANIAPGNSPGTLNVQDLIWYGGASYSNDLVDFAASPGTGWDYINGSGALTFSNNAEKFILRLDSGGGLAANFDSTLDYTLAIAGFNNGVTNFDAARFTIDTNAFANPFGGTFGVSLAGTNLYLTYAGLAITPDFVWSNGVTGSWSVGANWTNNSAAPTPNPSRILEFSGVGTAGYTASNGLGSFQLNQLVLSSSATGTNTILGDDLQLGGTAPLLYQKGTGMFIISNAVQLAADTTFRGPGVGTVVLASNITGTGAITKNGAWNLILQGSNSFVGPVLLDSRGGTLTLQNQSALGLNAVTVSNGTVVASLGTTPFIVGNGWSNQTVLLTGNNSVWTNSAAFTVGSGAAVSNSVVVDNRAFFYTSQLSVGTNGARFSSVTITNGGRVIAANGVVVGFGSASNTLTIVGGGASLALNGASSVNVGSGAGAIGNRVVIDGLGVLSVAVLSNVGGVNVGNSANGNSMLVTNGGRVVFNSGGTTIGNGGSSNALLVVGGGSGGAASVWQVNNWTFTVGNQGQSMFNTATFDGNGVAGGAVLTNITTLQIGSAGNATAANNNTFVLTNGGLVFLNTGAGTVIGSGGGTGVANTNSLFIVGGSGSLLSVLNGGGQAVVIGTNNAVNNSLVVGRNGVLINVGSVTVGFIPGAGVNFGNSLVITNGGKLFSTSTVAVGNSPNASNNLYKIDGGSVGSVVSNAGLVTIGGSGGGYNQMLVTNATVWTGGLTVGGGSSNNTVSVFGNTSWNGLAQTFTLGSGAATGNVLQVNRGAVLTNLSLVIGVGAARSNQLVLAGGTVVATSLVVNNAGNRVALNDGTLASAGTVYSNGTAFVIGDGTQVATFTALGGTHLFENDLVVTNAGVLAGTGNITVAGGNGTVSILNNGLLSPGSSPGTLTITGTNLWDGGGRYLWQISDFTGASAGGTDLVIATWFNIGANSGNPFVIDIGSLTPTNTSGVAANFDKDNSYTLTLAQSGGAGQVLNFDASTFSLVTTNFQNAFDGLWRITSDTANLYLTYEGATNFVWDNVTGGFATGNNWKDNVAPPAATTNLVLYFGGTIGQATYAASNDLTGLVTKRIVLTNQSANTQYIIGNSITLAGIAPEILQNQTGSFVISNNLVMATNTLFAGVGSGALRVDGSISGASSLTKTGTYALVLGGVDTYSGNTIIQQGQVLVANAAALSSSVVSNLVDGGLGFTGLTAASIGGLAGPGDIGLTNTAGAGVGLTIAGGGTYRGVFSGSGSLTKSGSGTETLSGTNTYTGDTLVQAGILTVSGQLLGSTNLLVTGGAFNWSSPTAMTNVVQVTVTSGGAVTFGSAGTIDGLTGNGQVNLGGSEVQVGFAGANTNFSGTLSGSGTLTKIGAGTWTLSSGSSSLSNVVVSSGTLTVGGASLTVSNLIVTGGGLNFNSGTLQARAAAFSNGQIFQLGNGTNTATYRLLGGTHNFDSGVTVASNATLAGVGTLALANGAVVLDGGSTIAPAGTLTSGTLSIIGTNVWSGNGRYLFNVSTFGGATAGTDWDLVNVAGVLSNAASSGNPFVVDVWSLPSAGFNPDANYTLTLATASGGVANYALSAVSVVATNLGSSYDGVFQVLQAGNNLVLSYTGSVAYVWNNPNSGTFNTNANWVGGLAPPSDQTNTVLTFANAAGQSYVAQNDFASLTTKKLILTNASLTSNPVLMGNALVVVGAAPKVLQDGAGTFVVSNNVTLLTDTLLTGSGSGDLVLAGNISGSGPSLTKTGSYTLVLGGSNTYSGTTVVNDGHLFIANRYGLSGSTLSNTVAGAVVFTNISTAVLGGLAGAINLGLTNTAGAGVALVVGGNNRSTTYGGLLSGAGSLTKAGAGTLTLSNSNTYSGATIVNDGTLIAGMLNTGIGGSGSSLGTSSNITVSGGTLRFGLSDLLAVTNGVNGIVSLNGGTLQSASFVNSGHVANLGGISTINASLANQGYLDVTNGTLVTLGNIFNSGVISNGATLKIGATGAGWMTTAGQVVLANGILDAGMITNTGTISGSGTLASAVNSSGLVNASGSNQLLVVAGAATGAGNYRAESGATLSFNGGGQVSSLFNTGATVRVAGGILTNTSAFRNSGGTLALAGGGYQASVQFTNTGWLVGAGSFNSAATLVNQGTITAAGGINTPLVFNTDLVTTTTGSVTAPSSALQVTGTFTNSGTLQVISGVGTYNQVVNSGTWLTTGGTSTFNDNFLITTNGYVAAASGQYVFKADLFNQSTNNVSWSTLGVTPSTNNINAGVQFLFSGSGQTQTQTFYHPGLLLTDGFTTLEGPLATGVQNTSGDVAGFSNNFAVGELVLTNTTLLLAQSALVVGLTNALFVNDLFLFGSHLVVSNDLQVYFVNSNTWNLADITLLGSAQIHQLGGLGAAVSMVIPEPNVLLMWLCGGLTFWAARRRARQHRLPS